MERLNSYELKNFYGGGFITTMIAAAVASAIMVVAFKLTTADEGKIKIPGGTEISFESNKKTTKSTSSSNRTISQGQTNIDNNPTLRQLSSKENTFYSNFDSFLIKY